MDLHDYIVGKYKQQYEYKSFSPELINHQWLISDGEIQSLLSEADQALGQLNAFSQLIPNVEFFIRMHITKEATQSSRIEGTQTNMEEALLEEQDIDPEKRDDWAEVQNYIEAINSAITSLDSLPLSNRLLKDTHETLMQGVRGEGKLSGEFRSSQNWIGVSLKNAVFVPPHHEELAELMSDLEKFMHNDELKLPHFSTRRQENAQTLMQYLYKSPVLNIKRVSSLLGLKPNTAATLVDDFVKYGVLVELTGRQRNRLYLFQEYFLIFKRQDDE